MSARQKKIDKSLEILGSGRPNGTTQRMLRDLGQAWGYEDPGLFLWRVMQSKGTPLELRVKCAETLLRYVHPKLQDVTVEGDSKQTLIVLPGELTVSTGDGKKTDDNDEQPS